MLKRMLALVAGERAHFQGHFHSHTAMLLGLFEYADAANDAGLKTFVRDGYEYARNFGVARIGWFPENTPRYKPDGAPWQSPCESCCTGDASRSLYYAWHNIVELTRRAGRPERTYLTSGQ